MRSYCQSLKCHCISYVQYPVIVSNWKHYKAQKEFNKMQKKVRVDSKAHDLYKTHRPWLPSSYY